MRWEKGKRRSSTGIKDSGKNMETRKEEQDPMVCCVYVCMVGFLYISAHEPSESVCVQKIQICTLRTSVYFNHLCG